MTQERNMRAVLLWGLVALLCQQTPVGSHVLGRASSTADLAQLKSLLERFEETLAEAEQDDAEDDYEGTNSEPVSSREWSQGQDGGREAVTAERTEAPADRSRAASPRSRLQDLLMATRKRASSCFGARMDRIGNASGLGCNSGRG